MTNTDERRDEVLEKYTPLFMRQPYFVGYGNGFLRDDAMGWTDKLGINVYVIKKTDPATLPEEDRIPACLEGIPIKISLGADGEFLNSSGGN